MNSKLRVESTESVSTLVYSKWENVLLGKAFPLSSLLQLKTCLLKNAFNKMARVFKDCFLTVLREQQGTELAIFPLNVSVRQVYTREMLDNTYIYTHRIQTRRILWVNYNMKRDFHLPVKCAMVGNDFRWKNSWTDNSVTITSSGTIDFDLPTPPPKVENSSVILWYIYNECCRCLCEEIYYLIQSD